MKAIVKQSRTVRLCILLALGMLIAHTSFAQFRLGPSVGFNMSTTVEDGEVNDIIIGLRAGLTMDIGIAKWFSIVPEVNFSQMGYQLADEDYTQTLRLNYIQVPLNLVFKIGGAHTKFLVFTGAYGAYAIGGNMKNKPEGGDVTKKTLKELDLLGTKEGQINPLDIGINLGLGMEIKSIYFKLQYNAGLNNMSNNKDYPVTNAGFALSLGYLF